MRLLLINNNPAVSRLLKLSVDKAGHEMDEFEDFGLVPLKSYDVIMVDNERYDESEVVALKEQTHCDYCIYVCQRGSLKPDTMNVALEKPFLPTDFLSLLEKVKNVIESHRASTMEEISLDDDALDIHDDPEEVSAFDIDSIDGLNSDDEDDLDDNASILPSSSDEDDDNMDELGDDALALDDTDTEEESLPTFDLDTKDEDLELSFPENNEDEDDFNFNEQEEASSEELKTQDNTSSVLDKDDINEVKQLLDDDEEESGKISDFEDMSLETVSDEDGMTKDFDFAEDEDTSPLSPETTEIDDLEGFDDAPVGLDLEDESQSIDDVNDNIEDESLGFKEEPVLTQEEIIEDFNDEIEEKIEEERISDIEDDIDIPQVRVEAKVIGDISSLDELSENLLKKAFGEEVEEDEMISSEEASPEIEVIRGEIESSIAKSVAGFAQSDILREALRGMKINISITFDDKN